VAARDNVCDALKVAVVGANWRLTDVSTVKLTCLELLPRALVARTAKLAPAMAAGVPLITPVDLFNVSPAESEPLVRLHVIGALPVAARV
jgi:hypothetical protein